MDLASTILRITRTGDADCTRSAPTLPTTGMVVLTPTTTSPVPQVVALSQWTVLELGVVTVHVSMSILQYIL